MLLWLSLLAALAQNPRIAWVPNPRAGYGAGVGDPRATYGGWVADPSHHLLPATVDSLDRLITALEAQTGAELAVVVVDSTSGLAAFDFALALHRAWGVGKRDRDNGVVLLWVPPQREVFISVGYGLEGVLPDSRTGRIRDTHLFPYLRRGEYDRGMLETVNALAEAIRAEPLTARVRSLPSRAREVVQDHGGDWLIGIAAVVGSMFVGLPLLRLYRRRRPRRCPQCGTRMRRLSETEDDQKLVPGELREEELDAVDYDIWYCDVDQAFLKQRYPKWFTKYKTCPECHYKTLTETATTLSAATTLSGGRELVVRRCLFCRFEQRFERSTPRLATSSGGGFGGSGGGGGGGGGSFGGGSAGGGGAGGRY